MRPRGEADEPGTGLYLAAALVGTLSGLVGGAFHALLDAAERGRTLLIAALAATQVPGWLVLMVVSPLVLILAQWLVRRLAPETAGSGIPEVEAVLAGRRAVRWRRVLPVKFLAGTLTLGSGLVLGREGPTVHLGSALGQMVADGARYGARHARTLVAAGAAAGLAAAFNAPLAAIVFVTEELREHFEYGFASLQAVILAACLAMVASSWMLGQGPALPVPDLPMVPLASLPLFLLLGVLVGVLGVIFNGLLLGSTRIFQQLRADHAYGVTAAAGLVLGALLWWFPQSVGGGETLVESLIHQPPGVPALILLLAARTLTSVGSYGLGLPGGIFAPMLALGTIAGIAFDLSMQGLLPALGLSPGLFAVAAMGALFAATVRAPLTGIVLTVELTGALDLVLPIILTCLSATFAAEALGGRPVYGLLLALGDAPPPPLPRPRRRVLVPALGLAALVVIGRSAHWSQSGGTVQTQTDATSDRGPRPALAAPIQAVAAVPTRQGKAPEPSVPQGTGAAGLPPVAPDRAVPAGAQPGASAAADGRRYVIQLISFRRSASLAPFVESHGLTGRAGTLAQGHPGQAWHPVLLGDYASRDEAQAALERLPDNLQRLGPIIRTRPVGLALVPPR